MVEVWVTAQLLLFTFKRESKVEVECLDFPQLKLFLLQSLQEVDTLFSNSKSEESKTQGIKLPMSVIGQKRIVKRYQSAREAVTKALV